MAQLRLSNFRAEEFMSLLRKGPRKRSDWAARKAAKLVIVQEAQVTWSHTSHCM